MSRFKYRGLLIISLLLFFACSKENIFGSKQKVNCYKIAIILPSSEQIRWERIVNWALDNIDSAQEGLSNKVKLELVWQDEESQGWETFANSVVQDDSFVAIIGPISSINAQKMAKICKSKEKTLILPIATSTEFQRIYAGCQYVWNLSQSDITQCELLLSQAKLSERNRVSLLTSNDDYGQSFSDWFAFQAVELGLEVDEITIYTSETDIKEAVIRQYGKDKKYSRALLFAPSKEKDAIVFDSQLCALKEQTTEYFEFPLLLCSDVMNSSSLISKLAYTYYEGLAPSATPESGFNSLYYAKFGEYPICGEAHLFDAISLLAYSLTHFETHRSAKLNESILAVIDGRSSWDIGWLRDDMHKTFSMIRRGSDVDLSGVTSDWTFDERTHASVLNTTYNHWLLRDGEYTTLEYLSVDGGANTISTTQTWEWKSNNMLQFNPNQQNFDYPTLENRWAVVIGTSDDWINYRHQADALAMYQLLKRHGYDDEHIILIIEDNIAYHPNNIYPGIVRVKPNGENLYKDIHVDYQISNTTIDNLRDILMGESSSSCPQVISSTERDNITVFWCGHGYPNRLSWGSNNTIYGWQILDLLKELYFAKKYRKILFCMDACYSGGIAETCEGIPGVLFITAANANETSKADMKDSDMGIWLSNGFTRAFQETIDQIPNISMRDLYYILARQTIGSHASVYNYSLYGNMYDNNIGEYLNN